MHRCLIIVLALVFVVSVGHSLLYEIRPSVDAGAYDAIGWNLAQGNGYIENLDNLGHPERDNAIARVGPGYQFFLAGLYFIFGHTLWVVWVAQALLRALTALFIYKISGIIFSEFKFKRAVGLLAAALFGFSPDLIILNSMLLTETLAIFLLIFSVWIALKYFESRSILHVLLFSLLITLGFLTRTTFLLVLLLFFVLLLWQRKWTHALLVLVFPVILATPWVLRNMAVYDQFVFTTAAGGYDMWVGNNPDATGGFVKTPEIQVARDQYHITELERIGLEKYFQFITDKPFGFFELQMRKASVYFSLLRPTGFWTYLGGRPFERIVVLGSSAVFTAILLIGGAAGGVLLLRKYNSFHARFFVGLALLQPIAVIPIIVESRYRAPFLPFLAVLAAFFIVYVFCRFDRSGVYKTLGIVALVFALTTFYDVVRNAGEFIERLNDIGFL